MKRKKLDGFSKKPQKALGERKGPGQTARSGEWKNGVGSDHRGNDVGTAGGQNGESIRSWNF